MSLWLPKLEPCTGDFRYVSCCDRAWRWLHAHSLTRLSLSPLLYRVSPSQDATPFKFNEQQRAVEYFGEQLRDAGFAYYGSEPLYSGQTGLPVKASTPAPSRSPSTTPCIATHNLSLTVTLPPTAARGHLPRCGVLPAAAAYGEGQGTGSLHRAHQQPNEAASEGKEAPRWYSSGRNGTVTLTHSHIHAVTCVLALILTLVTSCVVAQ